MLLCKFAGLRLDIGALAALLSGWLCVLEAGGAGLGGYVHTQFSLALMTLQVTSRVASSLCIRIFSFSILLLQDVWFSGYY